MSRADRDALIARWNGLTRETLPAMAAGRNWPIRLDHCFMRVCLDAAFGSPWTDHVRQPATRTMTDAQLLSAIAVAERIVVNPGCLRSLNAASLDGRRAARSRPAWAA